MTPATRMLVVWCSDWPIVAAGYPPSTPVAVLAAGQVTACSAAARTEGVARGQRRRQAEASCPGLVVIDDDPGAQVRAFEPVVAALERFTPSIEVVRAGLCAFATRGPSRYFGGDQALARAVAAQVETTLVASGTVVFGTVVFGTVVSGTVVSGGVGVGVADGRLAAELAARRSSAVVVPVGESADFLSTFSVTVLDRPDLADLLRRLGIHTLGQFADLPAAAVLARFGPEGEIAHRLAQGLDERPLAARRPPPELTVSAEIDPPAERADSVAFTARGLALELFARLAQLGLATPRVKVEAESEHGEQVMRTWRVDGGSTFSSSSLADRVRWQLDGWLSTGAVTAGITLVRLEPDEVGPDRGRQLGFWGGDGAADERATRALARIQARLGPDAVVTAVVEGGRTPAAQVRLVRWGDDWPAGPQDSPWPGRIPTPAPALVHLPPFPAQVVDASGTAVGVGPRGHPSARPARLSIAGGRWAAITAWAGPWPYDERWWDPAEHRCGWRWQVVTAPHGAHLLSLEDSQWRVEATYD